MTTYTDNEEIGKIKLHFKKYKVSYCCLATGIVATAFTTFLIRGRNSNSDVVVRPFALLSRQTISVVNVVEREGRGHPGYITRCLETMEDFITQGDAARSAGVHENVMSMHIRGLLPDVKGLHYARIAA